MQLGVVRWRTLVVLASVARVTCTTRLIVGVAQAAGSAVVQVLLVAGRGRVPRCAACCAVLIAQTAILRRRCVVVASAVPFRAALHVRRL